MRNPRVLLAAGIALVVVVAAVVLLSSGRSANSGGRAAQRGVAPRTQPPLPALPVRRATLRLERFTPRGAERAELLISLPAARLNAPRTTGGARSVTLTCISASGAKAFAVPTAWPLQEEFGYPLPHIHVPAGQQLLDGIRRCRLTGPGIDFEGRVPGRLPVAR
jgi:hypothetical protein